MITTYQADSFPHASTDPGPADLLIGREKLIANVANYIQNGRSVLVVGAAGMGKTAILQAVAQRLLQPGTSRTVLYCGEATKLRKTLQLLAEGLYDRRGARPTVTTGARVVSRRRMARLPIRILRRFVLRYLKAGQFAVLLDHLKLVRGTYASFVDQLVEDVGVPIVAAACSLSPDETGRLWWVGWNFTVIEVTPLSRKDARRLIEHCLDRAHIDLPDRQDFASGVTKRAGGNPRIIVRLCQMASAPQYQVNGRTDLRLLWLDWKILNLRLGESPN